jgi:hypothetical protein
VKPLIPVVDNSVSLMVCTYVVIFDSASFKVSEELET